MKKFVLFLIAVLFSDVAEAKLSSNKIEKERENIQAVLDTCKFDKGVLEELKGKVAGSTVSSSVATVASAGGAVASGVVAIKQTKDDGVDKNKLRTARVLSTAASGVATGANVVTIAFSETSQKKLRDLIGASEKCSDALKKIEISN